MGDCKIHFIDSGAPRLIGARAGLMGSITAMMRQSVRRALAIFSAETAYFSGFDQSALDQGCQRAVGDVLANAHALGEPTDSHIEEAVVPAVIELRDL